MTGTAFLEEEVRISIGPRRIVAAFFQRDDLVTWLGVRGVAVEARTGGLYLVEWPPPCTGSRQAAWEGTLAGVLRDYHETEGFTVDSLHWVSPEGETSGPTELTVRVEGKINQSVLKVRHGGFGRRGAWDRFFQIASRGWKDSLASLKRFLDADSRPGPSG